MLSVYNNDYLATGYDDDEIVKMMKYLSGSQLKASLKLNVHQWGIHTTWLFCIHLKEARKEMFYLTTHSTHFNTVMWSQVG